MEKHPEKLSSFWFWVHSHYFRGDASQPRRGLEALSFLAKGGDVGHTSSYYFNMRNTAWSFSWKNVAF